MTLRIAIAQLDFLVGDVTGNACRALQAARKGRTGGAIPLSSRGGIL